MSKSTFLNSLLEAAEARAAEEAAQVRRAAKKAAKAERQAATDATDATMVALATATGQAKANGGFPAVTALMEGTTAYLTGSATREGVDPATVAERDALLDQVATLESERDDLVTQVTNLKAANTAWEDQWREASDDTVDGSFAHQVKVLTVANSNLQANLDAANISLGEKVDKILALTEQVESIPKIDLSRTTLGGGDVKVSVSTAKAVNDARSELRSLLGI